MPNSEKEMVIGLHPKQMQVLSSTGTEILYGGSAGSGKSHLMRVIAMTFAYDCPGIQIYLFRRAFPDLEKNHVHGENGLLGMMNEWFKTGFVTYNASKHIFNFANGSTIFLCHLGSKKDLQNYQGAEIHLLLLDEAGQFEEDEYRYLRARVRLGGWRCPERWEKKLPLIVLSANPGGIGHMWLRDGFVVARPPNEVERMPAIEGGMLRQYIPARLSDNPTMDADYADKLSGMGNPELVRAWLDGDWDVVAGTALELLNRKTHGVRRFPIPEHWTRIMGMDWGTAKPFAVLWCAVAEGGVVVKAKEKDQRDVFIPDGALVFYREYYGWNGKADTGCRMTSSEVARAILDIEEDDRIDYRVGDSAMWAQTDGPSPQENMYKATNGKFILRQAQKDRAMNYLEVRNRLKGNEDGQPMLFFMDDLLHFWRTVPNLQLDEDQPEKGPDTQQEDHCFVAGTKIKTMRGDVEIQDIKDGDFVLTHDGSYQRAIQLGKICQKETYKVVFEDGSCIVGTGNHPILVSNEPLKWSRLDSLHRGMVIPCLDQKLYQKQPKCFWEQGIIYVAFTFKEKVKGFIGLFSKQTLVKFPVECMSITKMATGTTIIQKILNLKHQETMFATTAQTTTIEKNTLRNKSKEYKKKQKSGIKAQKGKNGIKNMLSIWQVYVSQKATSVFGALRNFCLKGQDLSFVLGRATKKTGAIRILDITKKSQKNDVWNLHVPVNNSFVLSNGVVVHNCYDALAYLCRSRPYTTSLETRKEREFKSFMKRAKKAGVRLRGL